MRRRCLTLTVDVEAQAGEEARWDEEQVERTLVDAVDAALVRVAYVLGDAPAWVIDAEAREDGQGDDDAVGTIPDKALVGAGSPTI